MSETVTDTIVPTTAPTDAPDATTPPAAAPDASAPAAPVDGAPAPQDGAPQGDQPPKKGGDRRVAQLTARAAAREAEFQRESEELRARIALLEAAAPRPDGGDTRPAPVAAAPEAVRAEAERLRQAERFSEARASLVRDGVKEYGEEVWNEKTSMVHAMGATNNAAFMEALVELPEASKLVAALADDPDQLTALLSMRPAVMAAKMGRMAAELVAPKPRQLSGAPPPVQPLRSPTATPAAPDVYDTKQSVKEWIALRNKQAPAHLGGVRKRA